MDLNEYKKKVDEIVIKPMLSYMAFFDEDDDCGHTAYDVEACRGLLYTYMEALAAMEEPSDDAIMEQVKAVVLALNDLNEKVDYSLIETEEREALWQVIQTGAVACGLKEYGDDITEEWREW